MIDLLFLLIDRVLIRLRAAIHHLQRVHVLSQLRVIRLQFLNFLNGLLQPPPSGLARQRPQLMQIPLQLLFRPLHEFAVRPAVEVHVLLLHGVEFRGQQALG